MLVDQQALLQFQKFDYDFIFGPNLYLRIEFELVVPRPSYLIVCFKLTHLQESMWVNQTIPQIDSGTNMFEYYCLLLTEIFPIWC